MPKDLFGTINKGLPVKTAGKTFFVSDTTGALWNELNLRYPPDADGVTRVYSSVTSALASCTSGQGDVIGLASDFTTALTAAEILSAETKGVTVIPLGKNFVDIWFAERATASLPQSANSALFTVTGKVKLLSIQGVVTTKIQDQACTLQLNHQNNAGHASATNAASFSLCAATNFASESVGVVVGITGTLANSMVSNSSGAVYQAAPIFLTAGSLKLQTSASNTGSMKWRVEYIPMEPGARVVAA